MGEGGANASVRDHLEAVAFDLLDVGKLLKHLIDALIVRAGLLHASAGDTVAAAAAAASPI